MRISDLERKFLKEASEQRRKIAIGICYPEEQIVDTLYQALGSADITIVGSEIPGFDCISTKDDDAASEVLVDLIKNKKVDGFIRAQVKDSYTHKLFIEKMGGDINVKNIPIFFGKDDYWFCLSNPSNYNSLDAAHKKIEAERAARYMQEDLGIEPKIAVMSTRRLSGRVGEFGLIEEIAQSSQDTAEYLRNKGYDVKEYYIEYEKAIWEKRNLLVASSGMVGNSWNKALVYLGGWHVIHAPYLDKGAYYDDTARNTKEWFWQIVSMVAWINRDSHKIH